MPGGCLVKSQPSYLTLTERANKEEEKSVHEETGWTSPVQESERRLDAPPVVDKGASDDFTNLVSQLNMKLEQEKAKKEREEENKKLVSDLVECHGHLAWVEERLWVVDTGYPVDAITVTYEEEKESDSDGDEDEYKDIMYALVVEVVKRPTVLTPCLEAYPGGIMSAKKDAKYCEHWKNNLIGRVAYVYCWEHVRATNEKVEALVDVLCDGELEEGFYPYEEKYNGVGVPFRTYMRDMEGRYAFMIHVSAGGPEDFHPLDSGVRLEIAFSRDLMLRHEQHSEEYPYMDLAIEDLAGTQLWECQHQGHKLQEEPDGGQSPCDVCFEEDAKKKLIPVMYDALDCVRRVNRLFTPELEEFVEMKYNRVAFDADAAIEQAGLGHIRSVQRTIGHVDRRVRFAKEFIRREVDKKVREDEEQDKKRKIRESPSSVLLMGLPVKIYNQAQRLKEKLPVAAWSAEFLKTLAIWHRSCNAIMRSHWDKDERYKRIRKELVSSGQDKKKKAPEVRPQEELTLPDEIDCVLDGRLAKAYAIFKQQRLGRDVTEKIEAFGRRAYRDALRLISRICESEGLHWPRTVEEQGRNGVFAWVGAKWTMAKWLWNGCKTEELPEGVLKTGAKMLEFVDRVKKDGMLAFATLKDFAPVVALKKAADCVVVFVRAIIAYMSDSQLLKTEALFNVYEKIKEYAADAPAALMSVFSMVRKAFAKEDPIPDGQLGGLEEDEVKAKYWQMAKAWIPAMRKAVVDSDGKDVRDFWGCAPAEVAPEDADLAQALRARVEAQGDDGSWLMRIWSVIKSFAQPHKDHDSKAIQKTLYALNSAFALGKNIRDLASFMLEAAKGLLSAFSEYLFSIPLFKRREESFWEGWFAKAIPNMKKLDEPGGDKSAIEEAKALVQSAREHLVGVKMEAADLATVRSHMRQMQLKVEQWQFPEVDRTEAVFCLVLGKPGQGKSTLLSEVAEALAALYNEKFVAYDFGAEFHDDCRGQHVLLADDVMAAADPQVRAEEAVEIIRAISCAKPPVNQAFTKSQTPFSAHFVIASGNITHFQECGLTEPAALARRTDLVQLDLLPEARDGKSWKYPTADEDPDTVWRIRFVSRVALMKREPEQTTLTEETKVAAFRTPIVQAHQRLGYDCGSWMSVSHFMRVLVEARIISEEYQRQNSRGARVLYNRLRGVEERLRPVFVPRNEEYHDVEEPIIGESKEREETPKRSIPPNIGPVRPQGLQDLITGMVRKALDWGIPSLDVEHREMVALEIFLRNADDIRRDEMINSPEARRLALTRNALLFVQIRNRDFFTVYVKNNLPASEWEAALTHPSDLIGEIFTIIVYACLGGLIGLGISVAVTAGLTLAAKSMAGRKKKEKPAEEQKYDEDLAKANRRNLHVVTKVVAQLGEALTKKIARLSQQTCGIYAKIGQDAGVLGRGLFVRHNAVLVSRHVVRQGGQTATSIALTTAAGVMIELVQQGEKRDFALVEPEDESIDFAVLHLQTSAVNLQGMRDIVSYFIPSAELGVLRFTDVKMIKIESGFAHVLDLQLARWFVPGHQIGDRKYMDLVAYEGPNAKGDSGAVVVVDTTQTTGCILGLHSLGDSMTGYATAIPRESVEALVGGVENRLEPHGLPWEFPALEECPTPEWMTGAMECLGKVSVAYKPRLPRKTKILPSLIAPDLKWKTELTPAILAPIGPLSPLHEGVQRMKFVDKPDFRARWYEEDPLNMALRIGPPVFQDRKRPFLSFEEAIKGIPGVVKSIDTTRSAGWPLNAGPGAEKRRKKGDFIHFEDGDFNVVEFVQHFNERNSAARKQATQYPVVSASLKDETRPWTGAVIETDNEKEMDLIKRDMRRHGLLEVTKEEAAELCRINDSVLPEVTKKYFIYVRRPKKTRLFFPVNVFEFVDEKVLLTSLILALKKNRIKNGTLVGFTPTKLKDVLLLVTVMMQASQNGDLSGCRLLCYDIKNNDLTCYSDWKRVLAKAILCWFRLFFDISEEVAGILFVRIWGMLNPLLCLDGFVARYAPLFASGLFATFELNCLLGLYKLARWIAAALKAKGEMVPLEKVTKEVAAVVGGDDTLASIPEWIADVVTPKDIRQAAVSMGFDISSASVHKEELGEDYCTWSTATVVKRSFRWEGNIPFMPLDKQSILGNLAWQRERGDARELTKSAMENQIREAFLHGKEFYLELSTELGRLAVKNGIELIIPTFDSLMAEYVA